MGLYIGIDATYKHTVVQYFKLTSHSFVLVRNGGDDTDENPTQGHCKVQSDRQRRRRTGKERLCFEIIL